MIIMKSRLLAILISIHIDRCIRIRIHLADVDGSLVYSTPSNPVRLKIIYYRSYERTKKTWRIFVHDVI